MLKSQYIVLVALLLSGTVLGFMDVFHLVKEASSDSSDQNTLFSRSAPLFGGKKTMKNIEQITPSLANLESLVSQYTEMSPEEIKAEIKRLIKFSEGNINFSKDISIIVDYLALKLGREFPSEVRNFIENDMEEKNHDVTWSLMNGWAQNDFDGAVEYLLKHDNKLYDKTSIFSDMINDLTQTDPEKALEWCFSRTGKVRNSGLISSINAFAIYHPDKIGDFVGRLQAKDLDNRYILFQISKKWGGCDWDTAIRWAETLSEQKKKESIASMFGGLGESDLKKATEEFKKQPAEDQANIASEIVSSIFYGKRNFRGEDNESSKQALDWIIANFSNDPSTSQIVHSSMSSSSLTPEFTNYVQKLPEGQVKDFALGRMADIASSMAREGKHTYEEAFTLTEQIKEPEIKKESIRDIIGNWIDDDPETLRTWIEEKSGLSDKDKQEQLKKCDEKLKRMKAEEQ